ncbi:MAG: GGDEF domain-containing protein [Eubacterium sp.]|nr:GGDEF domain-containing protein [Eubacterium sp.]
MRPKYKRAIISFVIFMILFTALGLFQVNEYKKSEITDAEYIAKAQTYEIQDAINVQLNNLDVVSAIIYYNDGEVDDFDSIAERLISNSINSDAVDVMMLAEGDKIIDVYPGDNLLGASLSESDFSVVVSDSAERNAPSIAEPFKISKEKYITVICQPVYVGNTDEPWGYVLEAILFPDIFNSADLDSFEESGFCYQLYTMTGIGGEKTVLYGTDTHLRDPIVSEVDVPDSKWYFAIEKKGGWLPKAIYVILVIGAFVCAAVIGLFTYMIESRRESIEREHEYSEINELMSHLKNAILFARIKRKGDDYTLDFKGMNDAFAELSGLTRDEAEEKGIITILQDFFVGGEWVIESIKTSLKEKRRYSREHTVCNIKDGTQIHTVTEVQVVELRDKSMFALASFTDVEEFKQAVEESRRDPMTGLLNKKSAVERIDEEIWRGGIFFMIDVDNFKNVNDTFGHSEGDKVLIKVADILRGVFRSGDIVSRFGGDEFMVFMVLDNVSTQFAERKAQELCDRAAEELKVYNTSVSVGAFIVDSQQYMMAVEAFDMADKALYESKEKGKRQATVARLPQTE